MLRTAPPPAVAELQAERNRLRAEYAMLARKVEVREDELKLQVAEQMAEVSRSRNRIERLSAEIDRRDAILNARDSEIARLKNTIGGLEAELNSQTGLEHEPGDGAAAGMSLSRQLAERDQRIERLRAEVDRLGRARSEAVTRERTVQERLKGRIEDLSALSRQIEEQRRELLARQSQSLALRQTMAERSQPLEDPAAEVAPAESEAPPQGRIEARDPGEQPGRDHRLEGVAGGDGARGPERRGGRRIHREGAEPDGWPEPAAPEEERGLGQAGRRPHRCHLLGDEGVAEPERRREDVGDADGGADQQRAGVGPRHCYPDGV